LCVRLCVFATHTSCAGKDLSTEHEVGSTDDLALFDNIYSFTALHNI
jgi:hypothetical protein